MNSLIRTYIFILVTACLLGAAYPAAAAVRSTSGRVVVHRSDNQRDKYNGATPLDEPDVYFDASAMELAIYGWDSMLESYYIEVGDAGINIVASETIPGYGLQTVCLDDQTCSGTATISITTSRGDVYTGTFYVP